MTIDELDKRLDLLKEYIEYRTDWLATYNGYHSIQLFYVNELGIMPLNDLPEGRTSWVLLSFDEWANQLIKVEEDERFVYLKNRAGKIFTCAKLPNSTW